MAHHRTRRRPAVAPRDDRGRQLHVIVKKGTADARNDGAARA
jgi:hypothetical protein